MQIAQAAAAETPVVTDEAPVVDPAAAALAAAAANAPVSTEAALLAKAEEAEKANRPAGLPEKFNSWEDMAKAYAELEAKQSAGSVEETPPVDTAAAEGDKPKEGEEGDKPKADDTPKAVDLNALSTEFQTNGALSEASYADLAAKGFDKATVDQFIAGQQALADAATARLTQEAGGKENLDRMFAWASTSLTEAEINEYNASFANSDVNTAAIAIGQLKAKYEAAQGKDPENFVTGKTPAAGADTYESWAEVTKDMSDIRYKRDPAFVAKVQAKLNRSNI
ncbi:hypothetical protein [Neorhizobium sp. S3-V5DH]|uniref:capsid assembly protein n=1 Tax=Neorhizobium sp. S3-V5DH TaxID=2485166 RepID=UPI001046A18B|nr:hypothetical protein [Neorhizobium sp. S3-V5DH]TCV62312.1 capsid assembly protein [Neorhizobium sp. S3-V5DH]